MSSTLKKSLSSGFTLIELLVVISIIAILSVGAMIMLGTVNKNSRDAKRLSDLKIIQNALERYHSDNGYYPASTYLPYSGPFYDVQGKLYLVPPEVIPAVKRVYLSDWPKDPNGSNYGYISLPVGCLNTTDHTVSPLCKGYCIYTKLETPQSYSASSSCTLYGGYNYAASN